MTIEQLPRLAARSSLVLAPLLHLASALAAASLATGAAAEVAAIAGHPDRYYLYTVLQLTGTALFVPVVIELAQRARGRAPRLAITGGGLMLIGVLVGIADSGTQLIAWQTSAHGADPAQMTALLHRFEKAPGATAIFMVGGLSLITGSLLLGTALWRSRAVPAWAALCLPAGLLSSIAANANGSRPLLIAGSLVLLAGLGRAATTPEPSLTPTSLEAATA